jgi:predicted CXXCH cytochrome family protein
MKTKLAFNILAVSIVFASVVFGADPDNVSVHNLGPAGQTSCRHCHTPHWAIAETPLWSHQLSTATYKIYQSSSLDADVGQPTGGSKLCLSCHDGTVALGQKVWGEVTSNTYIPADSTRLGTDLSDDHPISFKYDTALSTADSQLRSPEAIDSALKLDRDSEVQCRTCHDPHDNTYGNFLVMSNQNSQLCIGCHDMNGWLNSAHQTSTAVTSNANDEYLQQSQYSNMNQNGCNNCHQPHSAPGHERLLHFTKSEDNCLNCHDGSVAQANMTLEMNKISAHDVFSGDEIHKQSEDPGSVDMHVECVDCHNPHSIADYGTQAPQNLSKMNGIDGISSLGSRIKKAQFEYEVCFKCHADNPGRIGTFIPRQISQTNTRLEFSQTNPSFHPVVSPGVNQNVPSLKAELETTTVIYCTSCHNSDPSALVKGPHGSDYPPLLAYNYSTADGTQESEFAYQLCYSCHVRESILDDDSFKKHKKHIDDAETPCSVCHDPHGISSVQGNRTNNSHLINFDTSVVLPDPKTGRLEIVDEGLFKGSCYLECHGKKHSPKKY